MKKIIYLLSLLIMSGEVANAKMVANIDLPDQIQVSNQPLVLNGAGIRSKFFIDVYVAGIYLPSASQDATSIIAADEIQSIHLVIITSLITRDRLLEPMLAGVKKSAGDDYPKYEPRVKALFDAFNIEVKLGDTLDITWLPGQGTQVSHNGKALTVLPDHDFKKMLFGLWLSPNPAQESLKQAMLGVKAS